MGPDEAITGALALFGEKYGEEVRVSMGRSEASHKADHAYSVELCGGTHVRRTAISACSRLVEAVLRRPPHRGAHRRGRSLISRRQDQRVHEAAELLKVGPDEMIERLAAILDERRKLETRFADAKRELALGGGAAADTASAIRDLGTVKLFARTLQDVAPKDLRGLVGAAQAPAWLWRGRHYRRVGGRARPALWSASPTTSPKPTTRSTCSRRCRGAWRQRQASLAKPEGLTAPMPPPRSMPSRRGSPAALPPRRTRPARGPPDDEPQIRLAELAAGGRRHLRGRRRQSDRPRSSTSFSSF